MTRKMPSSLPVTVDACTAISPGLGRSLCIASHQLHKWLSGMVSHPQSVIHLSGAGLPSPPTLMTKYLIGSFRRFAAILALDQPKLGRTFVYRLGTGSPAFAL